MSAFFGIVHLDGRPVDNDLLRSTARFLERIGPHGQSTDVIDESGFVYAQLETTPQAKADEQPIVTPGYVLVGDVSLDHREELAQRLGIPTASLADMPDIVLTQRAWDKWGQGLTDHLEGDYAIAIWDRKRQRLFAARDRVGIRTFYYTVSHTRIVFSNALNALVRLRNIGNDLNEEAVADYLLFRYNTDAATTFFSDVSQLPPAHQVVLGRRPEVRSRYWQLPIDEPVRFRSDQEYLEQFDHHFSQAVADRTRSDSVGVLASGGMDSTSVAIQARDRLLECHDNAHILMMTMRGEDPEEDEEYRYAERLAKDLDVGFTVTLNRQSAYWTQTVASDWPVPGPEWHHWQVGMSESLGILANHSATGLTGHGGDSLFAGRDSFVTNLLGQARFIRVLKEIRSFRAMHGRRPALGLRTYLRQRFEPEPAPVTPPWLNAEFAKRIGAEDRIEAFVGNLGGSTAPGRHPRPKAYADLVSPFWPFVLAAHDPQVTGHAIQFRHPFFDVRLVRFLLSIDAYRWFHDKALLRESMKDRLPGYIAERPKQLLGLNAGRRPLMSVDTADWRHIENKFSHLDSFVDRNIYDRMLNHRKALPPITAKQFVLPLHLALWLGRLSEWRKDQKRVEFQ